MSSEAPPQYLLKKYKSSLFKATLKEFDLDDKKKALKSMSDDDYKKSIEFLKKQIDTKKYNDSGLVYYVTKNFPKDKRYKAIKEAQRSKVLKYFNL